MDVAWMYAGRNTDDFDSLVQMYGRKEFKSPRRSTVPLLAYWRHPEKRIAEFGGKLGFTPTGAVALDFEHELPVRRGEGRPSCTDLLITSGSVSLAIEAKSTEPRYEDVTKWLGSKGDGNRGQVLQGWLDVLREECQVPLDSADVAALPYQMIHRAASACVPGMEQRWLAYQLFDVSEQKCQVYLSDLATLLDALGRTDRLRACVVRCSTEREARQLELEQLWDSGERDLRDGVVGGLLAESLFGFEPISVTAV